MNLRDQCGHGRWEAHGKGWFYQGHKTHGEWCREPSPNATAGYHWSDGCPGGREVTIPDRPDKKQLTQIWKDVTGGKGHADQVTASLMFLSWQAAIAALEVTE